MTVNPLTEGLTPEQKKFVAENPASADLFYETEPLSPQLHASLEALKFNNRRFKQQKQVGAIHANSASRRGGSRTAQSDSDESPRTIAKKLGAPLGNQNARQLPGKLQNKKRGAPNGNQNARTHGFYARRLPQSQLDGLEDTTVRSLEDEIEVMRVFSRKVAELGAEVDDLDEAKSLLNTLANATGSINRLVRTHTHIPDKTLDPQWMLRQALLELEEEWPEYKQFGDQWRTPEEIAALDARIAARQAHEAEKLKRDNATPDLPGSAAPPPVL